MPNACRASCEAASCGDGVVDTGERCDPATGMPCNSDCSSEDPDALPGDGGTSGDGGDESVGGGEEGEGCGCRIAGGGERAPRSSALGLGIALVTLFGQRIRRRATGRARG
jgi:hypothetical protein